MAPFSRMTGGPEGTYRTCCYHPPINKKYTNVIDAFMGKEMNTLRERMLNNEYIKECEPCYYYDSIGELSQRQVINQEHSYREGFFLEGLEVSFDNKCNFACVTCKPESSTVWEEREGKVDKIKPNYDGVDFSKLKHLSFTGGEPTIQKEFSPKFFEMLDQQVNYDTMFFSMNTNCTKFVHKPWLNFIKKLKRVMIMASIDGVGPVGEWVRLGMRMDVWEKIALRWKDLLKDNKRDSINERSTLIKFTFENDTLSSWEEDNLTLGMIHNKNPRSSSVIKYVNLLINIILLGAVFGGS
jgi:uncharacterized radical SAM superfamily Fe-S cluster-containing enzyme